MTGKERPPRLPDVPTTAETDYPGVNATSWFGLFAPAAEPSRAEPSRAEPSRAEPSRAEPSRAEPSRAEPSRAEPKNMIDKPAADLRTVVQSPAFRRKVQEQGAMSDDLDPKQFGQGLNAELAGWPQVVRSSKIEAE